MILLTHIELDQIANAIKQKQRKIEISASLGRWNPKQAQIDGNLVKIEDESFDFSRVKYDRKSVYRLEDATLKKIQFFSEKTNKLYKLVSTTPMPTLSISGIYMHRLIEGGPKADNQRRLHLLHTRFDRLTVVEPALLLEHGQELVDKVAVLCHNP